MYQINILCKVCPEVIQPYNMKNRSSYWRKYKIQETLYTGQCVQWWLSPLQSRHHGTSHRSPNRHYLPCHIFLHLINSLTSLPFQRWFYFGEKPEVAGCQIWAIGCLSYLGDLMFCQKTLHEMWCMSRDIVVMKLPITSCPQLRPSELFE